MMATSPAELMGKLTVEQQRFYSTVLMKRAVNMLPLFEDAAFNPSRTFVEPPQAAEARRQLEAQQAQYAQAQQQAAWGNAFSQGAARPSSNPTPRELELMAATARRQGYDLSIRQMQEALGRQDGDPQTLTPEVPERAPQYLRGSSGDVAMKQALQMAQSGLISFGELRERLMGEADDDDPVWTDI